METEYAEPADLAFLRGAVGDGEGGAGGLGWEGVRAFEAAHGVVLPEPYRTFVAEMADGSAVGPPAYGLVPLGTLPEGWGQGRPERVLDRPFPLTEPWFWEQEEAGPCPELDARIEEVFDHGSVVLGAEGCGMYWHLVVTGPDRGHVWLVTGEGAGPFGAEFGFTTAAPGFAGWFRHWSSGQSWFGTE
ncbi:SMI1/KNR4 family protein [Actinacidiphila acidipaludis]|uniref:SMI1/KNR4 family protein n=1 Tax=Actinacidiphila acidipaludis TaxID=2873382 RepID=A0ABS7Q464_9ACTN|nr:SMI1/KNR4 family protein [Streptomyces acidipaludis]MBY8877636.1 SMI1/KNR4 family protein [Streptomyces acidipaludis]